MEYPLKKFPVTQLNAFGFNCNIPDSARTGHNLLFQDMSLALPQMLSEAHRESIVNLIGWMDDTLVLPDKFRFVHIEHFSYCTVTVNDDAGFRVGQYDTVLSSFKELPVLLFALPQRLIGSFTLLVFHLESFIGTCQFGRTFLNQLLKTIPVFI